MLCVFVAFCIEPIYADISGESERAATHALLAGISKTVIEGTIFLAAIGVMAAAIFSGVGADDDQANGHGCGSCQGH